MSFPLISLVDEGETGGGVLGLTRLSDVVKAEPRVGAREGIDRGVGAAVFNSVLAPLISMDEASCGSQAEGREDEDEGGGVGCCNPGSRAAVVTAVSTTVTSVSGCSLVLSEGWGGVVI